MTEIESALLGHCRGPDGAFLMPLRGRFGHTALYDAANRLAARGLLERLRRGVWRTTPDGVRVLEEPDASSTDDPITAMWPPLATLTEVLRSHGRLVTLAVVARTRGLAASHLPHFPIFGPTLSGKTTYGKMTCHAHGVPPERGVINTTAEAGKSISVRRKSTGAISTMRDALSWPVVVFDEVQHAPPDVWRALLAYLGGERRVGFENKTLDIVATSIVLLNPLAPKEAGLERRTGFDETLLRRSIPLDLEGIPLPPEWRTEGQRVLEAAARAGAIRIPELVTGVRVAREDVARALDRISKQEYGKWIDVEMVYGLCVAAAAIGIADPVMYVVTNWATVVRTVGWVQEGWRDALRRSVRTSPTPPTGFEPSPLGREVIVMAGDEATVTFEATTAEFRRVCEALRMSADGVVERLRAVRKRETIGLTEAVVDEIASHWEASGGNARRTATQVFDAVNTYGSLKDAVPKLTQVRDALQQEREAIERRIGEVGGQQRVDVAARALPLLDRAGVNPAYAERFLAAFASGAEAKGTDPAEAARDALDLVQFHARATKEEVGHERRIADLAAQIAGLQGKLDAVKSEAAKLDPLRQDAERLRQGNEAAAAQLGAAKAEATGVITDARKSADAIIGYAKNVAEAVTADATDRAKGVLADAATVEEAIRRARAREQAADEAKGSFEVQSKAFNEQEAALRVREEALAGKEEAIEVGEVATTLLWDAAGKYGDRAARRLEDLARSVRSWKAPRLKYATLKPETVRNLLMYFVKPLIDRDYVPKAMYERLAHDVEDVKAKVQEVIANTQGERRQHEEQKSQWEEEMRKTKDLVVTYEAWFRDASKMTPEQASFVVQRYGLVFKDPVEHALYVASRAAEPYLYCLACQTYFPGSVPTAEELYAMDARGEHVEITHPRCGRGNEYEPRVLLVIQARLAMPVSIRRAADGG